MIICITGQSGSGKSTLAKLVTEKKDYFYIDVDDIVHDMYNDKTMMKKYEFTFGETILDKYGRVDRNKVREVALKDKSGFDKLNNLTWGYIENKIDNQIKKHKNVVIDYKFLPLTKYFNDSNKKILVLADETKRKELIIKRDGITKKDYTLREKHSPDYTKYNYDYTLFNDYSEDFIKKCKDFAENL